MGYEIVQFKPEVQDYIVINSLDKNADGKINKDNGELQDLLTGMNKSKVYNLLLENPKKDDYITAAGLVGLGAVLSGALLAQDKFIKPPIDKWAADICKLKNCSLKEAKEMIQNSGVLPAKYESLIFAGIGLLGFIGIAAHFVFKDADEF